MKRLIKKLINKLKETDYGAQMEKECEDTRIYMMERDVINHNYYKEKKNLMAAQTSILNKLIIYFTY